MSILETFYLLFKSDSSDVEKGAKGAMGSVKKLNSELANTSKQEESILRISKKFRGFGMLLSSALYGGAVLANVKAAVDYAAQLGKASDSLGVSVSALDAWGSAVEKSGGTAEGFVQTLKSLTVSLNEIDDKGVRPAAKGFNAIGISIVNSAGKIKNAIDLLPELSRVFEGMSKGRSFSVGQSLGLDEGTITLLQRGRREVDAFIARQKELGLVTKQDAEIAKKFNEQWQDTVHAFRSIFVLVGSTILPLLTKVSKAFERVAVFFRKHSDFIVGSLVAIGSALLYIVTPAVLSTLAAFAPFLIIGGLFALIYDDIQNFLKGNDSVLGDIIKKYPIVGDILRQIAKDFPTFVKDVTNGFDALGKIIGGMVFDLMERYKALFDFILDGLEKIKSAYASVKSFLGFGDDEINVNASKNLNSAKQAINTASTSPISSLPPTSILNQNKQATSKNITVQTGPITIQTQATNSEEIAKELSSRLDEEMRLATASFDDGLMA